MCIDTNKPRLGLLYVYFVNIFYTMKYSVCYSWLIEWDIKED